MAGLPSVYRDGTTSITTMTKAVVGQDTMFTKSVLPGDFYGAHKGFAIMIDSIEDDTHLTLADDYPGPTQAAAAYKIMLQSDMGRMTESLRQLLVKLSSGNVDALAGLTGAADKFPFFTGAGTMDVGDVSPFARSNVLNKTDRASLLDGIGVSENVTKLMRLATDLNNEVSSGWVQGAAGLTTNLPTAFATWAVVIQAWGNGTHVLQTAYQAFGGSNPRLQYVRERSNAGVWSAWVEQRQQSFPSIQQGGGSLQGPNKIYIGWASDGTALRAQVDTTDLGRIWTNSAAVASSNVNGHQQFPNGIMIQWGVIPAGGVSEASIPFPTAFVSAPYMIVGSGYGEPGSTAVSWTAQFSQLAATSFVYRRRVITPGAVNGDTASAVNWLSIGRWF